MRLSFKSPKNCGTIRIKNGKQEKYLAEYRFSFDYRTADYLLNLDCLPADHLLNYNFALRSHPTLAEVLRVVGSHATLRIGTMRKGTYQGIVAPMDVQPTGWNYPSGKEFEPENFWQWIPDLRSEAELVEESNVFLNDPMQPLFGSDDGIFKSLVPYQLAHRQGKTFAIEAIPIQRLAGLVRKDIDWVFEFE